MPSEAGCQEEEVHGSHTNEASDRPHRDDRIGRHGLQQRGKRVAERGRLGRSDRSRATVAPTATPEPSAAAVTLEYLVDDSQANQQLAKAFADAYTAKHPNVTINVESRPGGTEGDNLVKTKLATGDMTDIFWYNAGSLLQALNPSQTLVDLTGEPYIANIADSFIPTVSQNGGIFGVPSGTAMGGGILYNKKIFADNGLTVPTTWAEFEANNDKLKAAGHHAGRRHLQGPGHLDLAAVRPRRLLQRRGGRPELRHRLHQQQDQVRRHPCSARWFPAPAGRI